jgi:tripartite-type tricarboxylate transporter receptor subunit TctC
LLGNNTGIVINRNLYKLNYDPTRDLAPVGLVASTPLLFYVNGEVPARNVAELVDLLKSLPTSTAMPRAGAAALSTCWANGQVAEGRVDSHIPARGQAPAMQDPGRHRTHGVRDDLR